MTEPAADADAPGRYAVLGNPVAHSQSPFIHAEFARQTGQRLSYERRLCVMDGFASALRDFADAGAAGCNVTMPFKFDAYLLCARRTPRAELAGACNTLRFDAQGWLGDNTDGAGLQRDIERNVGVSLRGARVLLIGAGGGAAGALGALLGGGAGEVVVANRRVERAEVLVARHGNLAAATRTRLAATALGRCGAGFDIVINATASSVSGAPVPVAADVFRHGGLGYDMMYGAAARPFLAWAGAAGATTRDGLGMLVEQAAEAFELWRGLAPRTDDVLAALRARLASM